MAVAVVAAAAAEAASVEAAEAAEAAADATAIDPGSLDTSRTDDPRALMRGDRHLNYVLNHEGTKLRSGSWLWKIAHLIQLRLFLPRNAQGDRSAVILQKPLRAFVASWFNLFLFIWARERQSAAQDLPYLWQVVNSARHSSRRRFL
jgi:hypothetical protein